MTLDCSFRSWILHRFAQFGFLSVEKGKAVPDYHGLEGREPWLPLLVPRNVLY